MSAETLREAARLMRERAEAAKVWDGYWQVHPERRGRVIEDKHGNGWDDAIIASCVDYGGTENGTEQAEHIASWHPAVALAVADWLDDEADQIPPGATHALTGAGLEIAIDSAPAVRLARTYLGGDA